MSAQTLSGRDPSSGQSIDVAVEGGRIVAITPADHEQELWISAGLIDLQVNGYGGHDLNTPGLTPETVIALAEQMRSLGTTTFLPTLITATEKNLIAALGAIAEARRTSPLAHHMIPFVHLEGPSICAQDGFRGAHPAAHVRKPDLAEFDRWQGACGGIVGMVTLSPHFAESAAYVRALVSRRVLVAIGHTSATHDEITAAVEAGASLSTHLGNGIAAMLPRHPNALWTQMADDRLTATLISDGHHLPAETLKVIVRAKGIANCIVVSDTVALAGMSAGAYTTPVGKRVTLSADGRLAIEGSQLLAGSVLPLRDTVLRATRVCGISLADGLRMAVSNPGRCVGRGQLQVGTYADLIQFAVDEDSATLDLRTVLVRGQEQN